MQRRRRPTGAAAGVNGDFSTLRRTAAVAGSSCATASSRRRRIRDRSSVGHPHATGRSTFARVCLRRHVEGRRGGIRSSRAQRAADARTASPLFTAAFGRATPAVAGGARGRSSSLSRRDARRSTSSATVVESSTAASRFRFPPAARCCSARVPSRAALAAEAPRRPSVDRAARASTGLAPASSRPSAAGRCS